MGYRLLPKSPALYHGKAGSRPYFEGWYFKQASCKDTFLVIPGVFRGVTADGDIAFIQVIIGTPPESIFIPFPFSAFHSSTEKFEITIGRSCFSMDKVLLDIPEIGLEAKLFYDRARELSRQIMGPFAYLPAMQCSHGVLSMTHTVNGMAHFKDKRIVFNNAQGYIEKDWGCAFPQSWIWMQCNDAKNSLMCAIASIPYGAVRFTGLICALMTEHGEYRFATYNGGKVARISKRGNEITAVLKRGRYRLEITARSDVFVRLKAPTKTGMNRDISESVGAHFQVALYDKDKNIYSGSFDNGGLELSEIENIIKLK